MAHPTVLAALLLFSLPTFAADVPIVREIFVPFEDLNVLLDGNSRRVFLARQEYEALLAKAKPVKPEEKAPQAVVVLNADYAGTAEEERVRLHGRLDLEVLHEGLHAVPLDLGGVGVRTAMLDETAAAVGLDKDGRPVLFIEGKGRKRLTLEMVTPLQTQAAQQTLTLRLPVPPATRLKLTVPGNVDVKSGAKVVSRQVDEAAAVTRFELLPAAGQTTVVMSLNNRILKRQRVVVARSVLVDEITSAQERLHATVSLEVLQGAADRFRFVLPEGFEPTQVISPLLSRWIVEKAEGKSLLDVTLREPAMETVVLNVAATRTPARLEGWTMPQLVAQDVAGQVAVIGLVVEDRLAAESLNYQGLTPIDNGVLTAALPDTIFRAEPGAPRVRPVAAYYAATEKYALQGRFTSPPGRLKVTTNVLLTLGQTGQRLHGGFTLLPEMDKLFAVRFSLPAAWHLSQVTAADGKPLAFERYDEPQGQTAVRVRLPKGVAPGEQASVLFQATTVPPGWLGTWKGDRQSVAFPVVTVADAAADIGAIAIRADEDYDVRPEGDPEGLTPLDEKDKDKYGLKGVASNLAYRYEAVANKAEPYKLTLTVERKQPAITARCYSFLTLTTEGLTARYEIVYDIRRARTDRLTFRLPEDTPVGVTIAGLDDVAIKEKSSRDADQERHWTVLLAQAQTGTVRLSVDFHQPPKTLPLKDSPLPLIRADGVLYQSGVVAVEGNAEQEIEVVTDARRVDVGELVASQHRVGRRLLGAFMFAGESQRVAVNVTPRPGYAGLPAAIVQRAELVTLLAASGRCQTGARYVLRTKAVLAEIQLPEGAKLWSAYLDGKAVAPQRDDKRLLIGLPADSTKPDRDLQIVYETRVTSLALLRTIETAAPSLWLRADGAAESVEVPAADVEWKVVVPEGYRLVRSSGTVFLTKSDLLARESPLRTLWNARDDVFAMLGGRMGPLHFVGGCSAPMAQRSMKATKSAVPSAATTSPVADSAPAAGGDIMHAAGHGGHVGRSDLATDADMAGRMQMEGLELRDETKSMDKKDADLAGREGRTEAEYRRGDRAPTRAPAPKAAPRPDLPMPTKEEAKPEDPFAAPAKPEAPPPKLEPKPQPKAVEFNRAEGEKQPQSEIGGQTLPSPNYMNDDVTYYVPGRPARRPASYWALEGVRSLPIELQHAGGELQFASLGVNPELRLTLASERQIASLAWSVAVIVFLVGAALVRRRAWTKAKYVVAVALVSLLLPLLAGLGSELGDTFDMAFYAAGCLVPYYLLIALARWISVRCTARGCASAAAPLALLLALSLTGQAWAQPAPAALDPAALAELIAPSKPIQLPADAVILPYNPEDGMKGIRDAQKVLVPYDKYVELWNRAFPDKKIDAPMPATAFSLAGAAFQATLTEAEQLVVTGHVDIDVFTDKDASVPLRLSGGVLTAATADGRPARLQFVQPQPVAANAPVQQAAQQAKAVPAKPMAGEFVLLHLSGKGRKRLEVTVRMPLERRGGWRVAAGRLPASPATALTLTVPAARTEVRLAGLSDRGNYETATDNQRIETALNADGTLQLQWRPKVAEAQVDRSLTATSEAVLDVQEDGLRLLWRLELSFPRARRDAFTIWAPGDYLVDKVSGDNVRGWVAQADEKRQKIEVTLLKETLDRETLTVRLSRRGIMQPQGPTALDVPVLTVAGANQHKGRLTIRRSPLLDLRVDNTSKLPRTDVPGQMPTGADAEPSPLGLRPYQSFTFETVPFAVKLTAIPPAVREGTAAVQSLLRIAAREARLETRVLLNVGQRPTHRIRLVVPDNLEIEQVNAPGDFVWSITKEAQGRVLGVYLSAGQRESFSVLVTGTLGRRKAEDPVPAPRLEVLDVTSQQGDIVVQLDPAFDVRVAADLKNCQNVLLDQVHGWLKAEQRPLARLAIRYFAPDYAATFQVTPRQADVSGFTVTNVKVTDVAIEETIVLDLTIQQAGLREVVFRLPPGLENAHISVPMLRQRISENLPNGWKRIRLVLQDEVTGQLRVLVENDRLSVGGASVGGALRDPPAAPPAKNAPSADKLLDSAPIPILETGRTDRRYVTLENASRDELSIVDRQELEPLGRQQSEWQKLAEILGNGITEAYFVRAEATAPLLTFKTQPRKTVETADAAIGLAETLLVLDAAGAYRAQQTYHVNNTSEQYLAIRLPPGALLWTATVANEPVKPAAVPGQSADLVHIPLIKTAEGDRDYTVVLKYGGSLRPVGSLSRVEFPLMRTENIQVERSQVRLLLPESHQWFDFGGTMGRKTDKGDLKAQEQEYKGKEIRRVTQALTAENYYARARSSSNLKQLNIELFNGQDVYRKNAANPSFKQNWDANTAALQQAQQQAEQSLAQSTDGTALQLDNRGKLNDFFNRQENGLARNVVIDLGENFSPAAKDAKPQGQSFNEEWLEQNKLRNSIVVKGKGDEAGDRVQTKGGKKPTGNLKQQIAGQQLLQDFVQKEAQDQKGAQGGEQQRQQKRAQSQQELARQYQQQLDVSNATQAVPQQQQGQYSNMSGLVPGQPAPPAGMGYGGGIGGMPGGMPGMMPPGGAPNAPPQTNQWGAMPGMTTPSGMPGPGTAGPGPGVRSGSGAATRGTVALPGMAANAPATPPAQQPAVDLPQVANVVDGQSQTFQVAQTVEPVLASLDVDLPERGTEFLFTTTGGKIEITARAVSGSLLDRLKQIGLVLGVFLGLAVAWWLARRIAPVLVATTSGAILLTLLGLIGLCGGFLPLAALVVLVVGLVRLLALTVPRLRRRRATT